MKLYRFEEYNRVFENSWLDNKLKNSSDAIRKAIEAFTSTFENIVKDIRSYTDDYDSDELGDTVIDNLKKSMEKLIKEIDDFTVNDDILTMYIDIQQSLLHFKNALIKKVEKMDIIDVTKISITEVITVIFDKLYYLLDSYLDDIDKAIIDEGNSIDDNRTYIKDLLKKISSNIKDSIYELDLKEIVKNIRAIHEIDNRRDFNYKAGTLLKYKMKDGSENVAEVANEVNEDNLLINMLSMDGKEKFSIKRSMVLGISDKDGDIQVTPEDIVSDLEDVKSDIKKMNKLRKFIDTLK